MHMLPVIKHRDNQQQDQRLDDEPPHVEGEKIAGFEPVINAVQVDRESDDENKGNEYRSLDGPCFIPEPEMNDDTGKEKV